MIIGEIMDEENDQPQSSNEREPAVMPTAFEIHDESYHPNLRPVVRRIG